MSDADFGASECRLIVETKGQDNTKIQQEILRAVAA